jgi:hypothetical protein
MKSGRRAWSKAFEWGLGRKFVIGRKHINGVELDIRSLEYLKI